jgi:alkyl sulfatase BDS1-like metallo-beta-lactamase superfamily hydrolase
VENALLHGRTQWALELCGHVRRVQPDNLRARWLWMQSLRTRASEQSNPPARNFYLTAALDSYGLLDWSVKREAAVVDVAVMLEMMKYRLKAELTDGVNSSMYLHFTDTGATYRLQVWMIFC